MTHLISNFDYAFTNGKLCNNWISVLDYFISKTVLFTSKKELVKLSIHA